MEVLGMLQHLASWQFLALVALLDVGLILLQLAAPSSLSSPLPPLVQDPDTHTHLPRNHLHPALDAEHAVLLEKIGLERKRLEGEVQDRVREIRALARELRSRDQAVRTLNRSLTRLEASLLRLQKEDEAKEREKGKVDGGV